MTKKTSVENEKASVKTSVKNNKASVKMSVKNEKVSVKTSVKILELLSSNPETTIPQMAESLVLSTRSVERNLKNLQKANKIERVGPDKGGYWKVNALPEYDELNDTLAALLEEPKVLYEALKKIIDSKKKQ